MNYFTAKTPQITSTGSVRTALVRGASELRPSLNRGAEAARHETQRRVRAVEATAGPVAATATLVE